MYNVSQDFKDIILLAGKREYKTLSFQLNGEQVVLEKEIKSIIKTFEGSHYSTTMQMLEVELVGKFDLMDKWVTYKRAVTHSSVNQTKQWVDYGNFKVVEQDYQDDTDTTKLVCYDGIINTHKAYSSEEMGLSYPASIKSIYMKLCAVCGLGATTTTFDNMDMIVEEDKWANVGEMSYRNVLDEIAEVSTSFIAIKNNKLEIFKEQEINYTVSENNLSKLNIGDKVGAINILGLAREPQHDVEYRPTNWYDIPVDDRKELAFENNQIVDKRRDEYIDSMFNGVKGLEFIEFEADTFGYGLFHVGDVITLKEYRDNKEYRTIVTSETLNNTTGTKGKLGSSKPKSSKEKYVVLSDLRKEGIQTYLMVDQQNGKITAAVEKVDELGDKTAKLEIDVDGLTSTVESIAVGDNLIYNLNGEEDMDGWVFDGGYLTFGERLRFYKGLTFNPTFVPIEVQSLSVNALKFIRKGKAITNVAYIVPTTIYSLKLKREVGTQTFKVTVLEYDKIDGQPIKRTPFIFNDPKQYEKLSIQPSEKTTHIRLEFETLDNNVLVLTEMMFTRGNPSDWRESVQEVKNYAETKIEQLANQIGLHASELEGNLNTLLKITAQKGLEIWSSSGNGITIYNDDNKETFYLDTSGNIVMDGNLKAGSVGDFVIDGSIKSEDGKFEVDPNKQLIRNGDVSMLSTTTTVPGYPTISSFTFENKKYPTYIFLRSTTDANFVMEGSGKSQTTMSANSNISTVSASNGNKGVSAGISSVGNNAMVTLNGVSGSGTHGVARIGVIDGESKVEATNAYFAKTVDCSKLNVGSISGPNGEVTFINAYRLFVYDINATQDSSTIGFDKRFKSIYLTQQPNVSSDVRYKENLEVFDGSLDMLRNVNAYRFNLKGDGETSHVGFKAQEVETHIYKTLYKRYLNEGLDKLSASRKANAKMDTVAMLNKDESYLSLLYGEIHTVLWQATKEIDIELRETKKELQEVKNELSELKELVNKLLKESD